MQIKNENVKEKLNIMERIILYGADQRGRNVYGFLRHKSMGGLVRCFVDKNAHDIKMLDGIEVLMLEDTLD